MKKFSRTPKNYDGNKPTSHRISDVLPHVLERITEHFNDRPDLVLASWPEIIGPQLASMTKAISFENGVLMVMVKNSTLYSLLNQNDKPKILNILRKKFPKIVIKTILFRIG
ncbi:Uncharacterized protein PHSC3_000339 [Chlamydiales bacterium STE3]|nr:Uncharacterized protein PHSC3_000339 [Chlamydiales bacterium STE3]